MFLSHISQSIEDECFSPSTNVDAKLSQHSFKIGFSKGPYREHAKITAGEAQPTP